jgi:hypothetical protein
MFYYYLLLREHILCLTLFLILVPPKRVIIKDDNGIELNSIAVFDEGSDVSLFCEAIGGMN